MTRQTFTVSTPAATTDLTTLQAVKDYIGITSTTEDDFLETAIASVSARACSYLDTARAEDGTVSLGRETLIETVRLSRAQSSIIMSRPRMVSVTSVVQNGTTFVEDTDFEVVKNRSAVYALSNGFPYFWFDTYPVVVTYVAGWLLPNDDDRNLPADIENAIINWIQAVRFNRTRDPLVKRESMLNGTYGYEVFGTSRNGDVPDFVAAVLDPYRDIHVA